MRPAPRLTLTPTELAAVVRRLGRGQSLATCLRVIALQRAVFTEARVPVTRRLLSLTQDR
jgi:hypothetical protein